MMTAQEYFDKAKDNFAAYLNYGTLKQKRTWLLEAGHYIEVAINSGKAQAEWYDLGYKIAVERNQKWKAIVWGMQYLIKENDQNKRGQMADNILQILKQIVSYRYLKVW